MAGARAQSRQTKDPNDGVGPLLTGGPITFENTPNPERFSPPPDMDPSLFSTARDFSRDPFQHRWNREETIGDSTLRFLELQREQGGKISYGDRDYQDSEGNIRRSHFNEVMNEHRLDHTTTQSHLLDTVGAKTEADARKDAQNEEISKLQRYLRVMRSALVDAGGIPGMISGLSVSKVDDFSKIRTSEIVHPATWQAEDFIGEGGHSDTETTREWRRTDHPRKGEFLRDDAYGKSLEIRIDLLIGKGKVAMLGNDWRAMESCVAKARSAASKLRYAPLDGVLDFYSGIARYGLGDLEAAKKLFDLSSVARGCYREGSEDLIDQWKKRIERAEAFAILAS